MLKPTGTSSTVDSQNILENENRIRLTPNPPAAKRDQLPQSFNADPGSQAGRAEQRAHAGRSHQNAQSPGPAVQDLVREDRHQHGIGHAHQTHQSQQQQDGAHRPGIAHESKSLEDVLQRRPLGSPDWQDGSMRISSRPTMTAM